MTQIVGPNSESLLLPEQLWISQIQRELLKVILNKRYRSTAQEIVLTVFALHKVIITDPI